MLINKRFIPQELKSLPQWVVYSKSKIPFNPITSMPASSTDPITWSNFEECLTVVEKGYFQGLGFVLKKENNIICIDLDKCYSNKILNPETELLIGKFSKKVYIERSPSKNGLHIILKGSWNIPRNKIGNIEVYDNKRYITITGDRIQGDYRKLVYDEKGINNLVDTYFSNWK